MGDLQSLAVIILWPGHFAGWSHRRRQPLLSWAGTFPAYGEKGLQLRSEILIEPAVNKRVVAGAAHGKPVKGEVQAIVGVDDLAGEQNDIAVQREPADCKDDHHQHQHLNGHHLLPLKGKVLLDGDIPNDSAEPEFLGHSQIGDGDNEKGQNVEQSECGQVQVLPE